MAHTEAPTEGSVILAAILLKLGTVVPKMVVNLVGFAIKQRWGKKRFGPHSKEVLEVIFGSLLGDGSME